MGVSLSATDSLNWLAKVVGTNSEELIAELGTELRPPTGVIFLPYLSGERTPHNDAMVRGAFIGLSHQTDRRALTQVGNRNICAIPVVLSFIKIMSQRGAFVKLLEKTNGNN
jgi:sugar (pentulose or hexulose) kinase